MTDRAALHEAITADPAADLPRLVYADFLDEHGDDWDRLRAAHIRASVETARHPHPDPLFRPLWEREVAAGEAIKAAVPADFPRRGLGGSFCPIRLFNRGILSGLSMPAHRLDAVVGPLVARGEPVLDVFVQFDARESYYLSRSPDRVRKLLASPYLRLIGGITMSHDCDPLHPWALLSAPELTGLHRAAVGADAILVSHVVQSPAADRLRELNVTGVDQQFTQRPADPADRVTITRLLADTPALSGLRELGLNDLVSRAIDLRPLIDSPHLSAELELSLSGRYKPTARLKRAVLERFPHARGYQLS